jgi:glycosyltransferase involved in cell wall biosynthesis
VSGHPLRIEFILPSLALGGMEMLVVSMVRPLIARGHRIGVTCIEEAGALAEAVQNAGATLSVVPTPGIRTLVHAPMLRDHFARMRPDVVHAHNGVWEKASRAARQAHVPSVGHTLHGFSVAEPWFGTHLRRWGVRHSDWVVAVSTPVREYLAEQVGVPADRLHTIINGVDATRFHPGPRDGALRARLGIPHDALLVGCVARLDPVKDHATLVEAFARALSDLPPDAHLALVGDGPLRNDLRARIAGRGLEGRVHLAGVCTDAPMVYREFDALALASIAEGTPMTILEGMASGLAIVATAVGGIPQLLDEGAGLLVPRGDHDALAAALCSVLTDAALRTQLGARARARAEAQFSADVMLDQYEAVYRGRPATAAFASPMKTLCVA